MRAPLKTAMASWAPSLNININIIIIIIISIIIIIIIIIIISSHGQPWLSLNDLFVLSSSFFELLGKAEPVLIQCKEVTNQTFWLVNNQRNSQIANQMRDFDVATSGYAENLRAKQW